MICDACGRLAPAETLPEARQDYFPPLSIEKANIYDLHAELDLIECTLQRLAERRLRVRTRLNAMSPISKLPLEVLTEIFSDAIWCPDAPSNSQTQKPVTPLLFGAISKTWRDVAWSTPLLWNKLEVVVPSKESHAHSRFLHDWLQRTSHSPLHIMLKPAGADYNGLIAVEPYRRVLETLLERSAQWHTLDAIIPPNCHDLLENRHFPMLTTAMIHPPKGSIPTFSSAPDMFRSSPSIGNVDLTGHYYSSMRLPLCQLVKFRAKLMTIPECLEVLRNCGELKECHFDDIYSTSDSPKPISPIHSGLDTMDISIKGDASLLLHHLTLPHLRTLSIVSLVSGRQSTRFRSPHLAAIGSLVDRSSCRLRTMKVSTDELHEDDVLRCLRFVPTIAHLSLTMRQGETRPCIGLTDYIVSSLDLSASVTAILLPRLESLVYSGPVAVDEDVLISALAQRWRMPGFPIGRPTAQGVSGQEIAMVSRLKVVKIRTRSPLSTEENGLVRQLLGEGMQLSISLPVKQ